MHHAFKFSLLAMHTFFTLCTVTALIVMRAFAAPLIRATSNNEFLDRFSDNLLTNFVNPSIGTKTTSVAILQNGDTIITGLVTYPVDVATHPNITDHPDLKFLDKKLTKSRTANILLRVSTNGTIVWATRTAICKQDTHFSLIVHEASDRIYVAGKTSKSFHRGDRKHNKSGSLILIYSLNAARHDIFVTEKDDAYLGLAFMKNDPDIILLVGSCLPNSRAFQTVTSAPSAQGVCATTFNIAENSTVTYRGLSESAVYEKGTSIGKDTFEHMVVSQDGATMYVAVKRQLWTNFTAKTTSVLLAVATDSLLAITQPKVISTGLAQRFRLAPLPDGFLAVAYVSHIDNKDMISLQKFTRLLRVNENTDVPQTWEREIEKEVLFTRPVLTEVHALHADRDGNLALVLYTSEVIDRLAGNYTKLASLTNPRVALVVVKASWTLSWIAQTRREDWWNGLEVAADSATHEGFVVVGQDRGILGSPIYRTGRMLLTRVSRRGIYGTKLQQQQKPTPTPSASPVGSVVPKPTPNKKKDSASPSPTPGLASKGTGGKASPTPIQKKKQGSNGASLPEHTPEESVAPSVTPLAPNTTIVSDPGGQTACIGISSRIDGRAILDVIKKDGRLRLQAHMQKKIFAGIHQIATGFRVRSADSPIEMLCTQWNDGTRLCATRHHVVQLSGRLVYMEELCGYRSCRVEQDIPINFKSQCGVHVPVNSQLRVTMHTGRPGLLAVDAMRWECHLQKHSRFLWWLTTL